MSDKWKGGWLLNNTTKQHSAVEQSLPVCSCHQNHFVHLFRFKLETTYMEKTLTLWSIVVSLPQVFFLNHKELVFTLHSSSTPRLDTTAGPRTNEILRPVSWASRTTPTVWHIQAGPMMEGMSSLRDFHLCFSFICIFSINIQLFCLQYIKKHSHWQFWVQRCNKTKQSQKFFRVQ